MSPLCRLHEVDGVAYIRRIGQHQGKRLISKNFNMTIVSGGPISPDGTVDVSGNEGCHQCR